MIFRADTTLYHPVEGARVFPTGEQHPGAAWRSTPFVSGETATLTQVDENGASETVQVMARFDPDGDGKPGGSKPVSEEKAEIRARIKELGGTPPHHAKSLEEHQAALAALVGGLKAE